MPSPHRSWVMLGAAAAGCVCVALLPVEVAAAQTVPTKPANPGSGGNNIGVHDVSSVLVSGSGSGSDTDTDTDTDMGTDTEVRQELSALAAVGVQTLLAGEVLLSGAHLSSGAGFLVMEAHTGDLCVSAELDAPGTGCKAPKLWSAGISGQPGAWARMAEYGVLEVYPKGPIVPGNDTRVWQSHTMADAGCNEKDSNCSFVFATNGGNYVMYAGTPTHPSNLIWQTDTMVTPQYAKNVIHIMVDDLRPEMNIAYKQSHMVTPNFDRLAKTGLVFDRAYCNIAVCAPSRNSFMSGIRPDVTGITNFYNHIREPGQPKITTTPQQFRNFGYTTLGGGKTFHINSPPYWDDVIAGSWSSEIQPYYPFWEFVGSSDFAYCPINATIRMSLGEAKPLVGAPKPGATLCVVDGDEYQEIYDMRLANHTIQTLRTAAAIGKPFYIAAGFRRPHRDFKVHKKYWDLYPDASTFAIAKHQTRDPSQPLIAFHSAGITLPNGTDYAGTPDKAWPAEAQRIMRKGYMVAVTQTDHYIGLILDELDRLGLTNSTIVAVHSDHGWQLGEHGLWDKQTEFDLATRVPLIIRVPWKKASIGQHTAAFAELVDMHPTLASLAGLPFTAPTELPDNVAKQGFGQDLSPVFDNPDQQQAQPGKNATFSQWPVCTKVANVSCMACTGPQSSRAVLDSMGYSIRTTDWRLTLWLPYNTTSYTGIWSADPIAIELYDHRNSSMFDFDNDGESVNLAGKSEFAGIEADLRQQLQAQYTWDPIWLQISREQMLKRQLSYDQMMGFFPYSGLPKPSK